MEFAMVELVLAGSTVVRPVPMAPAGSVLVELTVAELLLVAPAWVGLTLVELAVMRSAPAGSMLTELMVAGSEVVKLVLVGVALVARRVPPWTEMSAWVDCVI